LLALVAMTGNSPTHRRHAPLQAGHPVRRALSTHHQRLGVLDRRHSRTMTGSGWRDCASIRTDDSRRACAPRREAPESSPETFALLKKGAGMPGAQCTHKGLRGSRTQNIENNPMQSSGIVSKYRNTFDTPGQISGTMATSRNLQDASGPARVVVTTDAFNCPHTMADEAPAMGGLQSKRVERVGQPQMG